RRIRLRPANATPRSTRAIPDRAAKKAGDVMLPTAAMVSPPTSAGSSRMIATPTEVTASPVTRSIRSILAAAPTMVSGAIPVYGGEMASALRHYGGRHVPPLVFALLCGEE